MSRHHAPVGRFLVDDPNGGAATTGRSAAAAAAAAARSRIRARRGRGLVSSSASSFRTFAYRRFSDFLESTSTAFESFKSTLRLVFARDVYVSLQQCYIPYCNKRYINYFILDIWRATMRRSPTTATTLLAAAVVLLSCDRQWSRPAFGSNTFIAEQTNLASDCE